MKLISKKPNSNTMKMKQGMTYLLNTLGTYLKYTKVVSKYSFSATIHVTVEWVEPSS